ncbi:MAG: DinB family protein [Planctomycetota bacterium]
MTHRLRPHLNSIQMNEMMFDWAFKTAKEEDATFRLSKDTNSFREIAAHLVISRHGLCKSFDIAVDDLPWGDLGEGMEAGFIDTDDFPSLATIHDAWNKMAAVFRSGLVKTSDEQLAQPSPFPLPWDDSSTMEDFAALTVVHESYHIGQLGMITKAKTGAGLMNPPG